MERRVGGVLLGRWAIVAYNAALLAIGGWALIATAPRLVDAITNEHTLENVATGIGTILIAYGVLCEERDALLRIVRVYPAGESPLQSQIDEVCHHNGLGLLLLGLLIEVPVQLIAIPNDVLNTAGLEPPLFGLSLLFTALALVVLVRFSWQLATAGRDAGAHAEPAGDG
jgi:hypothetical protein